ncbi:transcription factor [Pseudomonas phage phiH1]|uniref:Transcription factor n=1 Tax=Pseudomonas phage phiH1 TaxID=2982871 RepID=A0AAX3D1A4_9CAUD|nr:transcription factor [Pseudomonas phage phiH1]UYD21628.1 transcription factor [Pseudomonas phage phiH1]
MIRFARIYFVRGDMPSHTRTRYEVKDPPCSGYGHVAIIQGDKRSTLLSPFSLQAWQVSNTCDEMRSAEYVDCTPEKLASFIYKAWEECVKLGFQRDFGVAAMVLTELGQPVPKYLPPPVDESKREESKRGGKPVNEEALRPCKPTSKRGEVAAFFMQDEPQSLHEAMARLGLTRSGVLSHLFTLNKDHGVGYELVSDCARLVVPEGFDLFAWVEPERPARAEKPARTNEDGTPYEPKKRTSGKPVVPEALKPIPEPSKRATVARMFVSGFFPIAEAMATLDLDRSAVLSHLFTINKENGLGYELSEDSTMARLIVPEGHVVFGAKQPRAKKGE